MDWQSLVKNINPDTARAFVAAARHVVDALLIEADRLQQAQGPVRHDYNTANLPRTDAPGGWLSHDELRDTVRRLSEAVAAEKWTDGVVLTLKTLVLLGGLG